MTGYCHPVFSDTFSSEGGKVGCCSLAKLRGDSFPAFLVFLIDWGEARGSVW